MPMLGYKLLLNRKIEKDLYKDKDIGIGRGIGRGRGRGNRTETETEIGKGTEKMVKKVKKVENKNRGKEKRIKIAKMLH